MTPSKALGWATTPTYGALALLVEIYHVYILSPPWYTFQRPQPWEYNSPPKSRCSAASSAIRNHFPSKSAKKWLLQNLRRPSLPRSLTDLEVSMPMSLFFRRRLSSLKKSRISSYQTWTMMMHWMQRGKSLIISHKTLQPSVCISLSRYLVSRGFRF